jgi:hypothetical protein
MTNKVGSKIKYRNQDGVVIAELLKPVSTILGFVVWSVKIVAVPKKASFGGNPKVGQVKKISSRWFVD